MTHALYTLKLYFKACYAKIHFFFHGLAYGYYVDPTAVVDLSAQLEKGVKVGPYAVIGPQVKIGADTQIGAHAVIHEGTVIGQGCTIATHAVVGDRPYDYNYKGEFSRVRLGNHVKVMEYAIVQRATGHGQETVVGDNSMLMSFTIVGHNCRLGKRIQLARNSVLAGHVQVDDYAFIGIGCTVIENRRLGRYCYIGANTQVLKDIPPFSLCYGEVARIQGINHELEHHGFTEEKCRTLNALFNHLWFNHQPLNHALDTLSNPDCPFAKEISRFVIASKNGVAKAAVNDATPEGVLIPLDR